MTADKKRLAVAFVVAAISDALSFWLAFELPVQWGIDLVTALLLFLLLGRKWPLLPGLIAEAIPDIPNLASGGWFNCNLGSHTSAPENETAKQKRVSNKQTVRDHVQCVC